MSVLLRLILEDAKKPKIKYTIDGKTHEILVSSALKYDKEHPAYKAAQRFLRSKKKTSNTVTSRKTKKSKSYGVGSGYKLNNTTYHEAQKLHGRYMRKTDELMDTESMRKVKESVAAYIYNSQNINEFLRTGKIQGRTVTDKVRGWKKKIVDHANQLRRNLPVVPLEEDLVVYRGIDPEIRKTLVTKLQTLHKAGRAFIDKGLISTSVSPGVAVMFTGDMAYESSEVMFRILLPRGTKVHANDANEYGYSMSEKEFLLPAGTRFRVVDDGVDAGRIGRSAQVSPRSGFGYPSKMHRTIITLQVIN